MASDARPPSGPVEGDFFQVLRRLECAHRELPRLGEAAHAAQEPVRVGQDPSLAFEASTVASVQPGDDDARTRLAVGFFGAFGANGPLPLHITEYALQRSRNAQDPTFARFVDLFHHRLLLLFYRAWANARPVLGRDRPESDRFAGYVGAVSGQDPGSKARRRAELDQFALYMACHFASHARHAEGLEKVVAAFFRVPVKVEELIGEWLTIPEAYTWKLGAQPAIQGAGALGLGTRLGRRTFERQFRFRIVLGPLRRDDYERFMQGGDFQRSLVALVERYAGQELSWDVRLVLEQPDRRPTFLNGQSKLGRSTHLVRHAERADRPFQDLIFTPLAQAG